MIAARLSIGVAVFRRGFQKAPVIKLPEGLADGVLADIQHGSGALNGYGQVPILALVQVQELHQ